MKYKNVIKGRFIERPNRFIARVDIDGRVETVHVKNTGRCRELLVPGANVILSVSDNPVRKTRCDLIAVYKEGFGLVNMDSQAPNAVVREWLERQGCDVIRPEYTYGRSRFDFYAEKDGRKIFMEVKGCTLEVDGTGYFPDAPTERGTKHLRELTEAVGEGYRSVLAFVIQMEGVDVVKPNSATDPAFATAFEKAVAGGVEVLYLRCAVEEDAIEIVD